jgi:peptidoglycan/xylan/chitin deacetylase (PgdA/CDA1 family)
MSDQAVRRGIGHSRIAVLGYHKIGVRADGRDSWFYVSEDTFERQLRWILSSGWQVVDVRGFLDAVVYPDSLPQRSVLLTFDDGYRSMREAALPLLQQLGLPAVLFVPSGCIGKFNGFDKGIEPEEAICDWDDLVHLERHGVSIQSHGVSHRRFSSLDEAEIEREVGDSKQVLENGLERAVDLLSYPYGDCGKDRACSAPALRRAGYKAAFGFGGKPMAVPIADVYHVERIPMGPETDLAWELGDV